MRIRTVRTLQALVAGAIPITLLAFSTGPPIKRTGAPVDGGDTCVLCHTSFPLNDDSGGSVVIRANPYTPGLKQMIEVEVNHPTAVRFGFQLTARLASDETKEAGVFTADDSIRVRCDSTPAADAPCNGVLEFAEHKQPTTNNGNPGPRTFLIEWTPPATDAGPVMFYAAGNATNGSNTPAGDHVYTTKAMIASASAQTSVVNAASSALSIAANGWVSIYGRNLATATRSWQSSDLVNGNLPAALGGTSVKINGKDAFVAFVSPTQINVLAPLDDTTGSVPVQVTTTGAAGASLTAQLKKVSPAFFARDNLIIAQHADFTLITQASPARPGEGIILYGTGFGATNPAIQNGKVATVVGRLTDPVKVRIGGVDVEPFFAGVIAPGLYQINVVVPAATADGDIAVVATINGVSSQGTAIVPVKK